MNKKLIATIAASVMVFIIAGVSLYALRSQESAQQKEKNQPAATRDRNTATPAETGDSGLKTGQNIILTKFNATFALPKNIDVTDIKIIYKTTDKYEVAVVASKALASKLNKEQCWGGTLEQGSFAEITRYTSSNSPGELKKVGNHYYRVDEGPAFENCYEPELYEKYYSPAVLESIKSTLKSR